jgi:hypothetical protein
MDLVERITALPFAMSDAFEMARQRYDDEYLAKLNDCLKEVVEGYKSRGDPYVVDDPGVDIVKCRECRESVRDGYFVINSPRGQALLSYRSWHVMTSERAHREVQVGEDLAKIEYLLK